jgi:anti-anti-sigma factor
MDGLRIEKLTGPDDSRLFKLTGPFTISTLGDFQNQVQERGARLTLVDLTGVKHMDSAALGLLLGLHISCSRDGTKCGLLGVSPRFKTMFRTAGLDDILVVYDSLEAARTAVT